MLLAVITVVIALRDVETIDRLTATAVGVLAAVAAFFSLLMVADQGSNPFVSAAAGVGRPGPEPAAAAPGHGGCTRRRCSPPTPRSRCRSPTPPRRCCSATAGATGCWAPRSWTVAGWAFLSLGIGLGAWWAYVVLSWGGYWGWDPVENTSLIPWLTATALLHSMIALPPARPAAALDAGPGLRHLLADDRRHLDDPHRADQLGARLRAQRHPDRDPLDACWRVVAVLSVGLLAWRWRRFGAPGGRRRSRRATSPTSAPTSRSPPAPRPCWWPPSSCRSRSDRTVGPDTYRLFAEPLGVAVVAAVALCPLLALGRATGWTFWRAVRWPLLAAARRAARAAVHRRLAVERLRPGRPRGLLLRRRGRRHVRRGRRAAGRR